jgi:hypothetical protein
VLRTIEEWTGYRPPTCPWRSFWDPLVARVMRCVNAYRKSQLQVVEPDPSHRLLEGVVFFEQQSAIVQGRMREQTRKK